MASVDILTGQFVSIEQTPATIGDRMLARIIDIIVQTVYAIASSFLFFETVSTTAGGWARLAYLLLCILPPLMYTFLCEMLCNGQTVGKRVMKIRTVNADGSQPTMGALFLRWLLELIDIDMACIGVIPIIFTRRHQRIGDLAAGTMVIRSGDKARMHVSLDEFAYASPDYKPVYPGAANLTLRQAELIERVVSKTISQTRIGDEAYRLADKVAKAIHVNASGSPVIFLRTVLFDYRHYALMAV